MKTALNFIILFFALFVTLARSIEPIDIDLEPAVEYKFSYHAFLTENGSYICGATLITSEQLLTSAHCVEYAVRSRPTESIIEIKMGSTYMSHCTAYSVKRISIHPDYNNNTRYLRANNIAVVHLANGINELLGMEPILMSILNSNLPYDNENVVISRVNIIYESQLSLPVLFTIKLKIANIEKCNKILFPEYILDSSQLCTISALDLGCDEIQEGYPVVDEAESTLYGIVSAVYCNKESKKVTLYTKVSQYISYIFFELRYFSSIPLTNNSPPAINFPLVTQKLFI